MTDSRSTSDDGPRDLIDAELDARLAAANEELLAGIKDTVDVDAGMRDLYRRLSEQDLPGDPEFDVEAGLRDLLGRIRREHPEAP